MLDPEKKQDQKSVEIKDLDLELDKDALKELQPEDAEMVKGGLARGSTDSQAGGRISTTCAHSTC
jgi:hypothetical protein